MHDGMLSGDVGCVYMGDCIIYTHSCYALPVYVHTLNIRNTPLKQGVRDTACSGGAVGVTRVMSTGMMIGVLHDHLVNRVYSIM